MQSVFAQARAGLNLSPGQRAFLKLIEGLVLAAAVSALPVIANLLGGMDPATYDWAQLARQGLAVFAMALLMAVVKYVRAHYDPPIAAGVATVAASAEERVREWGGVPNDIKIEPDVVAPAGDTSASSA